MGSSVASPGYRGPMAKLLYKPLGAVTSVLGGVVAGWAFSRIWKMVDGDSDDAPTATDPDRGWRSVLTAAAIQGAVFGVVKAAIDRAGAVGFARAVGTWPA